jgi:Xaa-Pro aminopeptidase
MEAFLIYGDTEKSATLRHEVPLSIGDPFLFVGRGDSKPPLIVTNPLEHERIRRVVPDAELVLMNELGFLDMIRGGTPRSEAELEVITRAVQHAGVTEAAVPPDFPIAVADKLRTEGVTLTVDEDGFEQRRRAKNELEMAGIRRAQKAAEAAMAAARDLIRSDARDLTAEQVRAAAREACAAMGCPAPPDVMVTSVNSGTGHDPGSGPLPQTGPIIVDLWPRDEKTGCWADMTRTFVRGEITPEVEKLRGIVRDALEAARELARPGVTGRELYEAAAEVVEAAGYPTQRTAKPGETLTTGFYFSLGHGVGLDLHEEPSLGLSGASPLVPGDVIAVEPGIEGLPEIGGVRYEDLLLITADGCETLTDFAYDLTP